MLDNTGAISLALGAVFMVGGVDQSARSRVLGRRSAISFGAGISVAYVFVHIMPELHVIRRAFVASIELPLRYEGASVYFVSLLGFVVFYGLSQLRRGQRDVEAGRSQESFVAHMGLFSVYVGLMSYLLVRGIESGEAARFQFLIAMAFHFFAVHQDLREEFAAQYQTSGRFVLSMSCVLGWVTAHVLEASRGFVAVMLAFVAGAIIMNTMLNEVPREKDGRFGPFLAGSLLYGGWLLPFG